MKMRYITYILIGVTIALGGVFTGCSDDDDLSSIDMVAYLRPGGLDVRKVLYTPIPDAVIEDYGEIDFPVQVTRELEADATITLSIDESLVDAYNEKNGTNYRLLPANQYTEVGNKQVLLKKGDTFSSSYKLKVNEPSKLYEMSDGVDGFIIPFKITGVSSDDKGLRISDDFNVAYFIVAFNPFRYVKEITETLVGELHDRTGWSASANFTFGTGFEASQSIDGNLATSWGSTMPDSKLTIDMKSQKAITGLHIVSNYIYYGFYRFFVTGANIYASNDNTTWTSLGNISMKVIDSETGVDSYIYLYGTVNCRYIRIDVTETYQGFTSISEVDMIK